MEYMNLKITNGLINSSGINYKIRFLMLPISLDMTIIASYDRRKNHRKLLFKNNQGY